MQKEGEQARGLASVAVKLGPVKLALFYSTPYGSFTNYVENKVSWWYNVHTGNVNGIKANVREKLLFSRTDFLPWEIF